MATPEVTSIPNPPLDLVELRHRRRESALTQMVAAAEAAGILREPELVLATLLRVHRLGGSAANKGVAVPHARSPRRPSPRGALRAFGARSGVERRRRRPGPDRRAGAEPFLDERGRSTSSASLRRCTSCGCSAPGSACSKGTRRRLPRCSRAAAHEPRHGGARAARSRPAARAGARPLVPQPTRPGWDSTFDGLSALERERVRACRRTRPSLGEPVRALAGALRPRGHAGARAGLPGLLRDPSHLGRPAARRERAPPVRGLRTAAVLALRPRRARGARSGGPGLPALGRC